MTILRDQDCLAETLAFNAAFEAAAADRPDRAAPPDAATLAALRRNRLGGDTPPAAGRHALPGRALAGGGRPGRGGRGRGRDARLQLFPLTVTVREARRQHEYLAKA